MRVIIESDDLEHMEAQASVAHMLVAEGWLYASKPGDIIGIVRGGQAYGVRRNVNSIRVYLQPSTPVSR